jgi:hypothetical protein
MARMEERMARIESYLRLDEPAEAAEAAPPAAAQGKEEDLEFRIGQEWFARVGIAALGIGVAFTLSLPFPSLPPTVPSLFGYALAAGLLLLAGRCRRQLEPIAGHLRAVAIALGYFAGLRLCFFGDRHALAAGSAAGAILLTLSAGASLAIAIRRKSPWLLGLALFTGFATAIAVGSPEAGLGLVALFSVAAVGAGVRLGRPDPILIAMPMAYATYGILALDNPLLGRPVQVIAIAPWGPWILLACMLAFSAGLRRSTRADRENALADAGIFLNPLAGYAVYLLHTLASHEALFVGDQLAASAALLWLAFLHSRERGGVGPFICAMTSSVALSFAIIKATHPPDVFVWLSVQSVIVVATAIWLRSRFIIVANFAIYLAILACYVAVAEQEQGISLGFGVVALVTARLLAWKQERLELKTGLMRNAYLVAAFFIFPYALFHLVPGAWVGLAWVGAALLYYCLAALLHNRKYRWMAHGTLLLTALYLAVVGISRLEPLFRNLSFLVLGAVLLIVSLVFTRLRARR